MSLNAQMQTQTPAAAMAGRAKRGRQRAVVAVVLLVALAALALLLMTCGNTYYSPATVWRVLFGGGESGTDFTIRTLRLPRLLVGLLAGLCFGMAGNTFQTLLGNDLASPDIIGVTAGSSTAAVFCILMLHMSGGAVSFFSLLAGLAAAVLVYGLAQGHNFSRGRLILIGIGIEAMLRAVTNYLLLRGAQYDVATALRWLNGSLNNAKLDQVPILLLVTICGGAFLMGLRRHLEVMQLGDATASTLGLRLRSTYLLLIFGAVVLVAYATAAAGPIASVSFLAGPIASRLIGKGQANTLHAGLVGAVLVLAGDFIGQFALGTRYPVGVITGVLGAPYMIYLLIRANRKGDSI